MPKLFDLLSEHSDKDALKKIRNTSSNVQRPKAKKRVSSGNSDSHRPFTVPEYVAIDCETTGLNYRGDRLTEIGAVRFVHGEKKDSYSTLINPQIPIPDNITQLTGITNEMVTDAPLFGDITEKLLAFIGDAPLCGHQVDFDFTFINNGLKRIGKEPIKNRLLDTATLSRMLLDGLSGYSLTQVSAHLNVPLENAHRALDDALASGYVAALLVPKIYDIPPDVRRTMGQFAPYSLIKGLLLRGTTMVKDPIEYVATESKSYDRLTLPKDSLTTDRKTIKDIFDEKGVLAKRLDTYALRESQVDMADQVAKAINSQNFLVAEAGTGTGKSLAYLIPAALWAKNNQSRVIISTHTKNLQDQLIAKDLPLVSDVIGGDLTYAVLKGRNNYLCRNRWLRMLSGSLGNLSIRERFGVLPLFKWAEQTMTGDIDELGQFNRRWFNKVWGLISADAHGCQGRTCPHFKSCYLFNARQKALGSNVVVINHALFFSEISTDSSFLGKAGVFVFDEAHHLESCGYQFLRTELDTNRLTRYEDILTTIFKRLGNTTVPTIVEPSKALKKQIKRVRKNGAHFMGEVSTWAIKRKNELQQNENETRYTVGFGYQEKISSGGLAGFRLILKELQDTLQQIKIECDEHEVDDQILINDLIGAKDMTSQLKADLEYLSSAANDEHVFWLEGDSRKGWVKLCGVPLDIGTMLASIWDEQSGALVFTSATLSVSGIADYFMRGAGLNERHSERTIFAKFATPFVSEQMKCFAVNAPITPDRNEYVPYLGDAIISVLTKLKKNILVLFTANRMLSDLHNYLKSSKLFPEYGSLLAQNITGNRTAVLTEFKKKKCAVLLGTASFWEGIDAPGEACEVVIIPRLPFTVPTHPLTVAIAARMKELYGNSFFSYNVPEAVIKFRQGAGRLIRSSEDMGILIVTDNRLVTKGYGKAFATSLDAPFEKCETIESCLGNATSFFNIRD